MSTYYHCDGSVSINDLPEHISLGACDAGDDATYRIYPEECIALGITDVKATDGENWAHMHVLSDGTIDSFTRYGGNMVGFLCEHVPSIDEHHMQELVWERMSHSDYCDEDDDECTDRLREDAQDYIYDNFSDFVSY